MYEQNFTFKNDFSGVFGDENGLKKKEILYFLSFNHAFLSRIMIKN